MAQTLIRIPAGTTSAVFPLLANQNICAGPAVQGGTVQINVASNPAGPFAAAPGGSSLVAQSYRPDVNQYVSVTAATQAGVALISDMSIPSMYGQIVGLQTAIDSANATAEEVVFSYRLGPNTLPATFNNVIKGRMTMTNGAGTKTMQVRINGLGGTLIFQSPALANQSNYNFEASFSGLGDGATLGGWGAGATGGWGLSTTAYTTLARAYQTLETEVVVTVTKGTGSDTMTLNSLDAFLTN